MVLSEIKKCIKKEKENGFNICEDFINIQDTLGQKHFSIISYLLKQHYVIFLPEKKSDSPNCNWENDRPAYDTVCLTDARLAWYGTGWSPAQHHAKRTRLSCPFIPPHFLVSLTSSKKSSWFGPLCVATITLS